MTTSLMPFSHLMDSFFAPNTCTTGERSMPTLTPRADILEGDANYIIRMDVPGVNREDLQVELDGETLTVKAERNGSDVEGYRSLRGERRSQASYARSFQLGRGIDRDGVKAVMTDGVLTLTLPKNAQAVARRVEVQ